MQQQGDEVHFETEEARGATTTGTMRWVLGIGVVLAIALLSVIWMTGAATHDDTPAASSEPAAAQ